MVACGKPSVQGEQSVLLGIDTTKGSITVNRPFTNSKQASICYSFANQPSYRTAREQFDRDFDRLAATGGASFSDEGKRIGYITLSTGTFTDLTAKRVGGAFNKAPFETEPAFRPGTNELWFKPDPNSDILRVEDLDAGVLRDGEATKPWKTAAAPITVKDTKIDDSVASPTGDGLAFITQINGRVGLYTMPGGVTAQEPRLLMDLTSLAPGGRGAILEWRP